MKRQLLLLGLVLMVLCVACTPDDEIPPTPPPAGTEDPIPHANCAGREASYSFVVYVNPDDGVVGMNGVSSGTGGTVEIEPYQRCYESGTVVTVKANANIEYGYRFIGWVDGKDNFGNTDSLVPKIMSEDTSIDITINANKVLIAYFRK
jgi:hypothetical protein